MHKIALLPGDGIGPEVMLEATKVLGCLRDEFGFAVEWEDAALGGGAYDVFDDPLPAATLELAKAGDAILLGAVGGPDWDDLPRAKRPESGLLRLRSELDLFANLRPAVLFPELADASALKSELVAGLDLMIVRELTGGIYFGQPRGIEQRDNERVGFNTLIYRESEIERIGRAAFEVARRRSRRLCSVDKANVLECTQLWRDVMLELGRDYPDVELTHLYVDNAAMQLIREPKQFDVIVTTNMFGDILSDAAAMLTGSIGMLPSASLDANNKGMYEPIHGSAPDIAGRDLANPLGMIQSVAMMLRYSLAQPRLGDSVEAAVAKVLQDGLRTADIHTEEYELVGTAAMGDAVVEALRSAA